MRTEIATMNDFAEAVREEMQDRLSTLFPGIKAEVQQVDLSNFLPLFKAMGFKTLGDIAALVKDYSDAAYQIACFQMGVTDLDILSSSVAPQNLCTAFILKNGGGRAGLKFMLDALNGPSQSNEFMADYLLEQSKDLPFMNK